MFIILPVRATARAMPVLILMGLLFAGGAFLGTTAIWLFTAMELLGLVHLLAIPVLLAVVLIMFLLVRQVFKGDTGDAVEGFFAMGRFSAGVLLFFALSALIGGVWLGGFSALDERPYRLAHAGPPRQPGVRVAGSPNVAPALRLQAIFYNATRPSAIINGQTVLVGEQVAGWSVKSIEVKSVTLENAGGKTNQLWLK